MLSSQIKQRTANNTNHTLIAYTVRFITAARFRDLPGGQMGLKPNSIRNYKSFLKVWEHYTSNYPNNLKLNELNREEVNQFKHWLLVEQKYSQNHAGRLIGTLKTLCLDAQKNGLKTHPYVNFISGFSATIEQKIIHTLNFKELDEIKTLKLKNMTLSNVQKWIIIGFWIGQRVSDLLTLKPSQIRAAKNGGI